MSAAPERVPIEESSARTRNPFAAALFAAAPFDFRFIGRTLFHAALVGIAAGGVGAAFFFSLELVQRVVLEGWAGYAPLRAHGEAFLANFGRQGIFRPWLMVFVPGIGAAAGSLIVRLVAPEVKGGGGDSTIEAYHRDEGVVRFRVLPVRFVASLLTLGFGGSGGREGPTMHIGAALGSMVARYLKVTARERRILLVAGVAAGISAVFRTPLGAALFAVEVMYRDDFEADALIPSVLASVVAYSVVISLFGESSLFAQPPRFPFVPVHLPLYALLAILVAVAASAFLFVLSRIQAMAARIPVPAWLRPGLGGLALGVFATPVILVVDKVIHSPGQGIGIFGGGYGAAQMAIMGSDWFPAGSAAAFLFLLLGVAKIIATSLTLGSGGSAGDFGPSLVIGGLFGGAFGHAAQVVFNDPRISPGAFALVGMGTFYGGIAHVPLSSLVLVCELAGSYDLLVPMMLAEGIAFIALRKRSLYPSQLPSRQESPAHRSARDLDVLESTRVGESRVRGRPYVTFDLGTSGADVLRRAASESWQDVFPVPDSSGKMKGIIPTGTLRVLSAEPEARPVAVAADVMQPPITVRIDDDLRSVTEVMLRHGLREVPVVDENGRIVGFVDESDIAQAYLRLTKKTPTTPARPTP